MDAHAIADEKYEFKSSTRSKLLMLFGAGLLLFIIGVFMARSGGGAEHSKEHAATEISKNLVASTQQEQTEHAEAGEEHHGSAPWLKRIITTLWMNNVFFTGLGIIGLFFIAIQYAAQAGWSAGVKRIPLAMGHWIPIAGVLMLVLYFVGKTDIFHWTHASLYDKSNVEENRE